MRSRLLLGMWGLLGPGLAAPAFAQVEAAEPVGEEQAADESLDLPSETDGAEVDARVDEPRSGDRVRMDGNPSAPGRVHTVVKGDTLWDLSQAYLGSPWYWPKVWSYNPEIANPHWIYPGNRVRFFAAGEEAPTQVEAGEGPPGYRSQGDPVQAAEMISEDEAPPVQVMGRIGAPLRSNVILRQVGFVTGKELQEVGTIEGSFAETEMLSFPDTVYLTFRRPSDVRVGDRYVVFKTAEEVRHPITGQRLGYLTQFLGTVRVGAPNDKKLVTATIQDTWDEIYRGAKVGPFGEQLSKNVVRRGNERALKGYVVASVTPQATELGEHHLVVIDQGSSAGVQVGNTFTVVRQGDGISREKASRYPVEDIATCMAVDVKDTATTCLLTRSLREVTTGDRVEMRVDSGSAPERTSMRLRER